LEDEESDLQWPGVLTPRIEYVQRYASKDAAEEAGAESEDDDDMSSVGSFGDDDDEPAGQMDDV
jgi:ubiquitin-conjugating enzyme E2 H